MNWKKYKFRRIDIDEISHRVLLINLYFSQFLVLLLAITILWFRKSNPFAFIQIDHLSTIVLYGVMFGVVVLFTDWILLRFVPEEVLDDGGINDKIFRTLPFWHIALVAIVVAICEELLFRGALQGWIGNYWTSVIFAAIHFRYLRHWLMTSLVFAISYGLGWIYIETGSLLTPILAHFMIDFVLGCTIRYREEQ